MTKIYIDGSKRKPQERYIHLLSDALIYSSKLIGPYKYKVRRRRDGRTEGTIVDGLLLCVRRRTVPHCSPNSHTTQLAKIHSLETIDSAIPVDGDKTLVDVIRRNDYAIRSVPSRHP